MEELSGSREPGNSTDHSEGSSSQHCSREGFPNVTTLLWQKRASPAKLLPLGSGTPECSNSALLAGGFPSESVLRSVSASAPAKEGLHPNLLVQEIY